MSRHADGKTHLETDCLAVTPFTFEQVNAIYGMDGTLPKHSVDKLCLSHERIRAELNGAMILLEEQASHDDPNREKR